MVSPSAEGLISASSSITAVATDDAAVSAAFSPTTAAPATAAPAASVWTTPSGASLFFLSASTALSTSSQMGVSYTLLRAAVASNEGSSFFTISSYFLSSISLPSTLFCFFCSSSIWAMTPFLRSSSKSSKILPVCSRIFCFTSSSCWACFFSFTFSHSARTSSMLS